MLVPKPKKKHFHEQAATLMGLGTETLGKTQARQMFLPLVDELSKNPRVVEITDRDEPVAVLLSHKHFTALLSLVGKSAMKEGKLKSSLVGSVTILGSLEQGSKKIAEDFQQSIKRSAETL